MENFLRAVSSICSECHAVIPGKLSEEAGMVVMRESCPHHGEYKDLVGSNYLLVRSIRQDITETADSQRIK